MEFKALFGAEGRTSDFGVSAIFHESQQKMAEWHCGEFMYCHRYGRKGVHGEDIIWAEELERVIRIYPSLSGKGEMSRDVLMKDIKRNVCYGLELETESDYGMPERVMVYDACELEQQIKEISKQQKKESQAGNKLDYQEKKSRMKKTDFLLPVVTVVLYLGTNH